MEKTSVGIVPVEELRCHQPNWQTDDFQIVLHFKRLLLCLYISICSHEFSRLVISVSIFQVSYLNLSSHGRHGFRVSYIKYKK